MLPLLTITPLDLIVQWTDVNNKKNPRLTLTSTQERYFLSSVIHFQMYLFIEHLLTTLSVVAIMVAGR